MSTQELEDSSSRTSPVVATPDPSGGQEGDGQVQSEQRGDGHHGSHTKVQNNAKRKETQGKNGPASKVPGDGESQTDSSDGDVLTEPEYTPPVVANLDIPGDSFGDEYTDRRLWVGNLDSRMTEFAVLKLTQKFGSIRKMDFVYHKSGPEKGKSKGYCFVSFHTWEAADKARRALDGKFALGRPMYVKWAQGARQLEDLNMGTSAGSSSLATAEAPMATTVSPALLSKDLKIQAIEAKLRMMEESQKDFSAEAAIKPPPGWTPLPSTQRDKDRSSSRSGPYRKSHSNSYRNRRR